MGRKSISQRLDRAKTAEAKVSTLVSWSKSWERETMGLISQLETVIQTHDYDRLCIATGQLKAVCQKHFTALPSVLTRFVPFIPDDAAEVDPDLDQEFDPPPGQCSREMPEGYITAREWAVRNGKSSRRGQKILTETPEFVPAAIKVRNPHGGVDIWAVPKDTVWPF